MASRNLQAQQAEAGSALQVPTAIYDFSDAAYLKDVITTWPQCGPQAGTATDRLQSIDLEAAGAAAHGQTPQSRTPLVDITQGASNTCSAMAFCQAFTVRWALQRTAPVPQLSPLYAYYLQRVEECSTAGVCPCTSCQAPGCANKCDPPCVDCGSYLESAATIFRKGVCPSSAWPLTAPLNTPPSAAARAAAAYTIDQFRCLAVDDQLAQSLLANLANGVPVVLFINLTQAMQNWMQSLVAWPGVDLTSAAVQVPAIAGSVILGHVIAVTGYDAQAQAFIVRNSFGFAWGVNGRCTIPLARMAAPLVHSAVAIVSVAGP